MKQRTNFGVKQKYEILIEVTPIIFVSILPLFVDLSYQINLYLTWEGAYRLALGQIPYADFGIPMGFCYWIVPALFMKVFGTSLVTLAKAQCFIHIISGLSFRWISKGLSLSFPVRFLSILVFCLTFILGLQWPQYNHSVIVYQLIGLGFLLHAILKDSERHHWVWLAGSAFFLTFSFFTKQDAGALGILIASVILSSHAFYKKSAFSISIFGGFMLGFFLLAVLPFINDGIGYWFNYGQPPHHSRISLVDIVNIVMKESRWEKFYILLILLISFYQFFINKKFNWTDIGFTLLVLGIMLKR